MEAGQRQPQAAEKTIVSNIKERLTAAIQEADKASQDSLRATREHSAEAEAAFGFVREAAGELRDQLQSIPGIAFTINPDSVCITLVDRELWFGYDSGSQKFVGEESAHSWYDAERYATQSEWANAEACVDAMIRSCAQYFRMARAIDAASKLG